MRLVRLTRWDGVPIHVNPSRILYVEPAGPVDSGSLLVFDYIWHPELVDGRTTERVQETAPTVAGLFISPLGRDAA